MGKKPLGTISSVDNALRLISLLRAQGKVTVTESARALGVSTSTAQRLLSMLVLRDFAVRNERREYLVSPSIALMHESDDRVNELRRVTLPAMGQLRNDLQETITLSVLMGRQIRVVSNIEAARTPRVGDQEGALLPTVRTAAGRAMLSAIPVERVLTMLSGTPRPELSLLMRRLSVSRRNGFAVNNAEAEAGVSAVGVPILDRNGRLMGSIGAAMPSVRYQRTDIASVAGRLRSSLDLISDQLLRVSS